MENTQFQKSGKDTKYGRTKKSRVMTTQQFLPAASLVRIMLHLAFGKSSSQTTSLCLQPNIMLLEQCAPINGKATRWHLQAGFGSSCDPAVQLFACFSVFVFQQCRGLSGADSSSTTYDCACGSGPEPIQFVKSWQTMAVCYLCSLALFSTACKHCHRQHKKLKPHGPGCL